MTFPDKYLRPIFKDNTFDRFLVSRSNQWAHAMAVAASNDSFISPLYFYGEKGVGKTHLMHAMANALRFKKNLISLEARALEAVRELPLHLQGTQGSPPLLIIDDLQNTSIPKEDLYLLMKEVLSKGTQIIMAGRKLPEEIFLEKLNFKVAEIMQPEMELSLAVMERWAEEEIFLLPQDVKIFLLDHFGKDMGELLGAMRRLKTFFYLTNQRLTRFLAVQALKDILWPPPNSSLSRGRERM